MAEDIRETIKKQLLKQIEDSSKTLVSGTNSVLYAAIDNFLKFIEALRLEAATRKEHKSEC